MPVALKLRFGDRLSERRPSYDIGAAVPAKFEVRDTETGALTDASGMTVVAYNPDGTIVSPAPTVSRESTGVYSFTTVPTQGGTGTYRASITGPNAAVDTRAFTIVSETPVPSYTGPTAVTLVNGQPGPVVTIDAIGVSIERFGGVAGASDNSAAFAALLAYCQSADGLEAELPAGVWTIQTAPGEVPEDAGNQVMVPALTPARPVVIRGAGEGMTILRAKLAPRPEISDAPVSWPILRLIGGPRFELHDLTLDGGLPGPPSIYATTLSGEEDEEIARYCCTMVETDGTDAAVIKNVTVTNYVEHRDNTEWAADPAAFRSRRTGGLCIHRADHVQVDRLTLGTVSFREGIYFANCQDVVINGFRFDGDPELQVTGVGALSTALNVWGPETEKVSLNDIYIWNNLGSAINAGGVSDFSMNDFKLGGDGGLKGSGPDFGPEHQEDFFVDHPMIQRIRITNGAFVGCGRYSFRVRKRAETGAQGVTMDNVTFDGCYQGPEFSNVEDVEIGVIRVRNAFYRSDYSTSGRGVFFEGCERVSWLHITCDGSGGDGVDDAMLIGIYIDSCKRVIGGSAFLTDLTQTHFAVYQATSGDVGDSAQIHVGNIIAVQTLERDPASDFSALHFGRSSREIAGLSTGLLLWNGLPAIEQAGVVTMNATGPVLGVSREVRGDLFGNQVWGNVLYDLSVVNGDGSGALAASTRARLRALAGHSIGRGASWVIETSSKDAEPAPALEATEHGSIVLYPPRATASARTRRPGELWQESDGSLWVATSPGTVATQLSGVTATADGTTAIILSSAADVLLSDWLMVGATGPLQILALSGTTATLSGTVPAGSGLAVLFATATTGVLRTAQGWAGQSATLGTTEANQTFGGDIGRLYFWNSDGSSPGISAEMAARAGTSSGRGGSLALRTKRSTDALADRLLLTETGAMVLLPEPTAPRSRALGEEWVDSAGVRWRCSYAGRVSGITAPSGSLTATATGTASITLSATDANVQPGDWIRIGATLRQVRTVSGTTVTLDGTVGAGSGLAVTHPLAVVYRVALVTATTTAGRPSLVAADVGLSVLDTTLSRPIWWDGTAWLDPTSGSGGGALNNEAASDPTADDDSADGYSIGSRWLNTANSIWWTAVDVSAGAAIWMPMAGLDHPGYVPGNFYPLWDGQLNIAAAIPALNTLYLYAFELKAKVTINSLFVRVATGGANSGIKAGIWASNGQGRPTGAPLAANNAGVATTSPSLASLAISPGVERSPGTYFVGVKCGGTGAVAPVFLNCSTPAMRSSFMLGGATTGAALAASTSAQITALSVADAYANDLPTLTGAALTTYAGNGVPVIGMGV